MATHSSVPRVGAALSCGRRREACLERPRSLEVCLAQLSAVRVCPVRLTGRPTPARLSAGLSCACRLARRSARRGRTLGAALASGAHVLLGQGRGRLQGSPPLHQLLHRLSGSHPCRAPLWVCDRRRLRHPAAHIRRRRRRGSRLCLLLPCSYRGRRRGRGGRSGPRVGRRRCGARDTSGSLGRRARSPLPPDLRRSPALGRPCGCRGLHRPLTSGPGLRGLPA